MTITIETHPENVRRLIQQNPMGDLKKKFPIRIGKGLFYGECVGYVADDHRAKLTIVTGPRRNFYGEKG